MTKRPALQLTTIRLDDGMRDALKLAAGAEGKKYQTMVRDILRDWLKDWFVKHVEKLK